MSETPADAYRFVAPVYDLCAGVYSLGRIPRSKRMFLETIAPGAGDRVLFAGCGRGSEVLAAARLGARVTAVDRSARMLATLRRRAHGSGLPVAIHRADLFEMVPEDFGGAPFDLVVAHYFLNVFEPAEMQRMLRHLAGLVRPKGRLVIADFAPAEPGSPRAGLQNLYHALALAVFRRLAPNARHTIYDYEPLLPAAGLRLERRVDFPLPAGLLPGFRCWVARRTGATGAGSGFDPNT